MRNFLRTAIYFGLGMSLAACGASESPEAPGGGGDANTPEPREIDGETGKADGFGYKVKDWMRDSRVLSLFDLVDQAAEWATDGVNDALSAIPYADIELSETRLFGLEEGIEAGSEILSLGKITKDLAARFGARELTTQVNGWRKAHLETSGDQYFAESEFQVKVDLGTSFSFDAAGLPATVGFLPRTSLKARVVAAHDSNLEAIVRNPVAAAKSARGWVLPTAVDDVLGMKPGEALALTGDGRVGFNLGMGIPIFTFTPVDHLVVTNRFSLGARLLYDGRVEAQLIRGPGQSVYLDFSISDHRTSGLRLALDSGLGLVDFPDFLELEVLGRTVSVGDLAEKAIRKQILSREELSYGVSFNRDRRSGRVTLNRFRFDFSNPTQELEEALVQGFSGDLRLAQALALRAESGVEELVSLARDINTRRTRLGAHLSSMKFFTENAGAQGTVTVEDPDGMQHILFDDLSKATGKFFATWKWRRLMLTSAHWNKGEFQGATSNLRLEIAESDKYTSRDQVLDHVDALLVDLVDFEKLFTELTPRFEELQHEVDRTCDECDDRDHDFQCERRYEECVNSLITPEAVEAWRARLEGDVNALVSSVDASGESSDFVSAPDRARQLLDLKLKLSSVPESAALFRDLVGRSSIVADQRVTLAGMDHFFRNTPRFLFEQRLEQILAVTVARRRDDADDKLRRITDRLEDERRRLSALGDLFETAQRQYLQVDDITKVRVAGNAIGDGAHMFVLQSDEDPTDVTVRSLAEQKVRIMAGLYEALVERADNLGLFDTILEILTLGLADPLGFESHHLIAYTLLSLFPRGERELLTEMDFEEEAFEDQRAYSRGEGVELIGAGQFDIERLIRD